MDSISVPSRASRLASFTRGSSNQYVPCAALRLRWAFDFLASETVDVKLYEGHENEMSTVSDLIDQLKPADMLLRRDRPGLLEMKVRSGRETPVKGRLVAAAINPEKAAQRRSELCRKLHEDGKTPRRDQLEICEWVVVFTNAQSDLVRRHTPGDNGGSI